MNNRFTLNQVDLVFGSHPKKAFQALDQGMKREEILQNLNQVVAVHSVSLQVKAEEILVLMGLSGSGKSSLLRCLNGMNGRGLGFLRGQIIFKKSGSDVGIDMMACSQTEIREIRRHHISMVFQQFGLMPWRSVLENVAFPLEVQKISKKERLERAAAKLELVGLSSWKERFPSQLSGGMQQRVGLARAFVTDADVLLMDEPFSALDPLHRRQLQEEILVLQSKSKKTVLFVTHDPVEAARIADRIAVLDSGRLLQLDTPGRLQSHPTSERVTQLTLH